MVKVTIGIETKRVSSRGFFQASAHAITATSRPKPGGIMSQTAPIPRPFETLSMVARTVEEHQMLRAGEAVLLGVSGGPDSVALLDIMARLAPRWSLSLAVAHLNHRLRPVHSENDAAFVASLASRYKLPFFSGAEDIDAYRRRKRLSLEEAARRRRYHFLQNIALHHGFSAIALGHQADDNAELVLLYLLRGSGSLGLAGIPPVRPAGGGRLRIVRPLSRLSREQIRNHLKTTGLGWRQDRSNFDKRRTRNRIRHELLPLLARTYNPRIRAVLNRTADLFQAEHDWLQQIATRLFAELSRRHPDGTLLLPVGRLNQLPLAARRHLIRHAIADTCGGLRCIAYAHVQAALALAQKAGGPRRLDLPAGLVVLRQDDWLQFVRPQPSQAPACGTSVALRFGYRLEKPGELMIRETGDRITFFVTDPPPPDVLRATGQNHAFFDMDKVRFPLVVRNLRPGDRFAPLGLGGSQKVQKFFIDHKVPPEQRIRCPLVFSKGALIWIAGHRIAESAKIKPTSRKVLKGVFVVA
jgi:tRNA(Ile)-lysidine synthase